jgi:hypothetical protein
LLQIWGFSSKANLINFVHLEWVVFGHLIPLKVRPQSFKNANSLKKLIDWKSFF